jgi:hypothetical protein
LIIYIGAGIEPGHSDWPTRAKGSGDYKEISETTGNSPIWETREEGCVIERKRRSIPLTLFCRMSIFNQHTKNDPTVVCRHMINKFFLAFLWSSHMSLLAAVAMVRHCWMLYQASAAIWHT